MQQCMFDKSLKTNTTLRLNRGHEQNHDFFATVNIEDSYAEHNVQVKQLLVY